GCLCPGGGGNSGGLRGPGRLARWPPVLAYNRSSYRHYRLHADLRLFDGLRLDCCAPVDRDSRPAAPCPSWSALMRRASLSSPPVFQLAEHVPNRLTLSSDTGARAHVFILAEDIVRLLLLPDGAIKGPP